jgi:phytoene desaturase
MHVVVIGAGLGGLSTAAYLSRSGHNVTLLERDDIPGGRAGVIASHGFRWSQHRRLPKDQESRSDVSRRL